MIKKWLAIGDKISFDNQDLGKILYCVLTSQIFKDYKIKYFGGNRSIRLSAFIVSPTRSGKGQYTGLFRRVGKKLNLDIVTATKITDAGLVGTLDLEAIRTNTKNGYTENHAKYQNPVVYGDLYDKDIIIWNEAKTLLKNTSFQEDTLEILQEATDDEGLLRKKLSSIYDIEFNTTTSFIATTYYLEQLNKVLLEQGIFQRILVLVQHKDFNQRKFLNNEIINNIEKAEDVTEDIEQFCAELLELKKLKKEKIYTLEHSAISMVKKYTNIYETLIEENCKGTQLNLLMPFTTSYIELLIKVATLISITDRNNTQPIVKYQHIVQSSTILQICMKSILRDLSNKIDSSKDNKKYELQIIKYLKENPKVHKELAYIKLRGILSIGRTKLVAIIKDMIDTKIIEVEKKKINNAFKPRELLYVKN